MTRRISPFVPAFGLALTATVAAAMPYRAAEEAVDLLTETCLATAPGFASLPSRLEAQGFTLWNPVEGTWADKTSTTVQLVDNPDGSCGCHMMFHADAQADLVDDSHAALKRRYRDTASPLGASDPNRMRVRVAGADVVVVTDRIGDADAQGRGWAALIAIAAGGCQKAPREGA